MPVVFEEKRRRQRLLLGIFLILLIVGLFIGYREFFRIDGERVLSPPADSDQIPKKPSVVTTISNLEELLGIQLSRSIFEDPDFGSLEINGVLPIVVNEEELGRDNPFLPFEL